MHLVLVSLLIAVVFSASSIRSVATAGHTSLTNQAAPEPGRRVEGSSDAAEFDRLRTEGFDAVYNIDYKTAREKFQQMTRIAPDHPAGYVYLANNLWLETLYQS